MGSLISALATSGNALRVLQEAMSVAQNNIGNASTSGYAAQTLNMVAMPVDAAGGLSGGLAAAGTTSARDSYSDLEVQRQNSVVGYQTAQSGGLGAIQSLFSTTGTSGIAGALNTMFTSFAAWSASPTDPVAQQTVLSSASALATSFQGLNNSLVQSSADIGSQVGTTVSKINALAGQIAVCNATARTEGGMDPGTDAQLHTALESLANLTDVNTLTQADGTVTVLADGGSPLVEGGNAFALSAQSSVPAGAANPQSAPESQILDSQGNDITAQLTGGQLGGLLNVRNIVLGGIVGNGQNAGTLNILAKNLADTVNQVLTSGTVSTAAGAASGTALFIYSNAGAATVAGTLALNPAITAAQLAPADAAGNSNGNANALAALANPPSGAGPLNGMSWTQYLAQMTSAIGQAAQNAQQSQQTAQQSLTQAQGLRDQISGVSLDGEATQVMELQRSYQAVARALSIVNSCADSLLAIMPQS